VVVWVTAVIGDDDCRFGARLADGTTGYRGGCSTMSYKSQTIGTVSNTSALGMVNDRSAV
jgi:hypothetical protein